MTLIPWHWWLILLCFLYGHSHALVVSSRNAVLSTGQLNLTNSEGYHCVDQRGWIDHGFLVDDCSASMHRLHEMVRQLGAEIFQFLASGIRPSAPVRHVITPFRIRTGKQDDLHKLTKSPNNLVFSDLCISCCDA